MNYEVSTFDLVKINEALEIHYGYSFKDYSESSLIRRLNRILYIHNHKSIDSLILKLISDEEYFQDFTDELTVNTTEIFRDPGFWLTLRNIVLPDLSKRDRIRIWHAGCSSGEEILSITILLNELQLYKKTSILATDISHRILERAKKGLNFYRNYELNNNNYKAANGSHSSLDYYVCKRKFDEIYFTQSLFQNVEFKHSNLIKLQKIENPFDLIICRNVMIYFNEKFHYKVFDLFYEGLSEKGYLGIGSNESLLWSNHEKDFDVIDKKDKIYKKKVKTNE